MEQLRNDVFIEVRDQIRGGKCLPGQNQNDTLKKMELAFGALFNILYPLEPALPEMSISGFSGSEHVKDKKVSYKGDPSEVRSIVERSIALVQRYSSALERGDWEAAYALTGAGLRAWMSLEKFVNSYEKAARDYGGPLRSFYIYGFSYILADESARKKSNTANEGWPKATAKEVRRCRIHGFWLHNRDKKTGCGGSLAITEEDNEYRIVHFNFYRP
jgi:hypothetical protein